VLSDAWVQARIELSPDLRARIEPLRRRWNPERAEGNPAHVTLIYHDEAPSPELLRERLAAAATSLRPFELRVGAARRFPPPVSGVFLAADDPSGAVARLRAQVLAQPFRARARFGLHVTIVHPAHGERADAAWGELRDLPAPGSMRVAELVLVDASNRTLTRISLG
jgi:2'-5' RNA ligase